MKFLPLLLAITTFPQEGSSVRLLKRELSQYPLAKCNDGSSAVYFYDQDVRASGQKVLIYLPDSGHCTSLEDCRRRCSESSADKEFCTTSRKTVLEFNEGIWSSNSDDNPFADYFKVFIHSCSNDDFSGTRQSSRLTGNLHFQGKNILTSTLQDLVSTFGINQADSLVLVGSGTGARGVGYNCDYVSDAFHTVNSRADVRCILDSPDFIPWWVRTEADQCKGQDYNALELEHFLWGKEADQSCMEESRRSVNSSELYHKCGVFSRYWEHIDTPFFLINSQYNPTYFDSNPCGPEKSDPQYAAYQLSWRRGVIALMQVIQEKKKEVGIFSANCDSHSILSGVLAKPYWTQLTVPIIDQEVQESSLNSLLFKWRLSDSVQAVDSIMRNNSNCVSAAPHRVLGTCAGRLISCNRHATLLPSVARSGGYGFRRGLIRRLSPPSYIWPSSYNQHRRCGLDPYYSGCGETVLTGTGCGTCSSTSRCGLGGCGGTFLSGAADRVVPESAIPASGKKGRLWRRFYYLQYLKLLYNRLKKEYAREYYQNSNHHSGHSLGVEVFSSIRAPGSSLVPDYDDYYNDYYDYDYDGGDDIFARIVKAVKKNRDENNKNGRRNDPSKILLDSVQENFVFPQELLDALPDIDDIEYEDFESLNEQVESLNNVRRKKNFTRN